MDPNPTELRTARTTSALITGLAGLALFALAGCQKAEVTTTSLRPALAYKIPATSGVDTDVYSGEIRARVEADHAFRVGGKIIKRTVDVGSTVKRGQPLAQLDASDVALSADAAKAQVAALKTEADFAESELTRFRDLFKKGFVSQSALDQKLNTAAAAKARLNAQQAQANVSANQAGYATLVAESDGVVTQVFAEAGQVVSQGQPVVRIANPREKELLIGIPESQLAEFRTRMKGPMAVGLWSSPGKHIPAKVRELGSAADPTTRTYPARISIPTNDDSVQLGMSGYVVMGGARATGELSVPLSSIYIRDQGGAQTTGVWQIGSDGKVSLRAVEVIKYTEGAAIIKAVGGSLKPGDLIVAAGAHKIREGDIVKPVVDPVVTGDGKVAFAPSTAPTPPAQPQVAWLDRLFR